MMIEPLFDGWWINCFMRCSIMWTLRFMQYVWYLNIMFYIYDCDLLCFNWKFLYCLLCLFLVSLLLHCYTCGSCLWRSLEDFMDMCTWTCRHDFCFCFILLLCIVLIDSKLFRLICTFWRDLSFSNALYDYLMLECHRTHGIFNMYIYHVMFFLEILSFRFWAF